MSFVYRVKWILYIREGAVVPLVFMALCILLIGHGALMWHELLLIPKRTAFGRFGHDIDDIGVRWHHYIINR